MKLLTVVLQARRGSEGVFKSSFLTGVNGRGMMSSVHGALPDPTVSEGAKVTLESLKFVNRAIKSLPVEENQDNYVRTVQGNLGEQVSRLAITCTCTCMTHF